MLYLNAEPLHFSVSSLSEAVSIALSISQTQGMVTLDPRMRFPVLYDVERLCFEHFGSAVSLQRDHVKFEAVVKAFNMSASYAASFGSGASEHIQNWWDQCRVMVEDRQPSIHDMNPAALTGLAQQHQLRPNVKTYAAVGQGRLLGIVLGCTNASGQQLLFLKNFGAQMTLDNLVLGESTKRQDKMLAGQFGEGAKVEINRLVQEGCTVSYWTGNAMWSFEHRTSPGCTIPELHVIVQPGSDCFEFVGIAIVTKPSYAGHLLENDRFLFFQGSYGKLASEPTTSKKWSGLEILLDEAHHGKVFIHSIFVADAPTYEAFGLNYTGDKSIFPWLGLGRDRNAIDDRKLILGIPALFADIKSRIGKDQYKHAIERLVMLMDQKGTALQRMVDFAYHSRFQHAVLDQEQLTQSLHAWFKEHFPSAQPACADCGRSSSEATVEDLQYLGFHIKEVPETMYRLFKEAKLLKSREELWQIRKDEILKLPDPLDGLSPERRAGFDWMRSEVETVFKDYVKPGQIKFRAMPGKNQHVLLGLQTDYVIDINLVWDSEEVHKQLAKQLGSGYKCQKPCICQRRLLNSSMIDALCRQTDGPSRQAVTNTILAEYMMVSRPGFDLASSTSAAGTPVPSRPSSANGPPAHVAEPSIAANHHNSPDGAAIDESGLDLSALNIAGGAMAAGNSTGGTQSVGGVSGLSTVQTEAAVKIVQEHEAPLTPGVRDPLLFHNGIQAALASVLRHSAGQVCQQAIIRSCSQPSSGGSADTVAVRLCPTSSKHSLRVSDVLLNSCVVAGNVKQLYFSEHFDPSNWSQALSDAAQRLYELLERLHELILPGVAAVNMYYDADDGLIAFNQRNKLWYNAHADHVYDEAPQGLRLFNWYITVCHEVAHNFRHEHDEVFSDYLAHILVQHSRAFYALCSRYKISI